VRTEYYADLAGPFGISRTIAAVIRLDETTVSSISSMRPDSSEPFGRGERRVLRALMPHLQQALRIHRRVVSAEIGRATAVEALDAMPLGVIVLRTDASVVFANGAAQEILNARDGLESVDGRLQASAPAEDRRLRDLVGSAAMTAAGDGEQPGGTIVLPRPSMRLPLSVLVTPLRTVASTGLSEAHAAVFVADPERGVRVQSEVLQHLWGLTPAEASIASRIAIGQSVSDIAETLTLGEGTVRWHVKNVLSKTQTARQADLVRVITTGPSVVRRTGK
jgi:DNA-binding CsgD family transcriptional regulator